MGKILIIYKVSGQTEDFIMRNDLKTDEEPNTTLVVDLEGD